MNTLKLLAFFILQEARYYRESFLKVLSGKHGGYIEEARNTLQAYSPKPQGRYGIINKAIDESIDLSIVIPVYNVEKYLHECLQSVLGQNTKYTYEVICVDDESPDNSLSILAEYEANHPNLKVVRQKNRGHAGAKNRGLDESSGKYVMFVDSDDILEKDAVETMLSEAYSENFDIVCCGFYTFSDGQGKTTTHCDSPVRTLGDSYNAMKTRQCFFCAKVYKRSFWDNLRLPEGYWFEDAMVLHILSRVCNGYSYISEPLYGYRIHSTSISQTATNKPKSVDQYWLVEFIEEEADRLNISKDSEFFCTLLRELGPYLNNRTKNLPEEIRKTVFSAAADRVQFWHFDTERMIATDKRLYKALLNKDFYEWEVAASCWHSKWRFR